MPTTAHAPTLADGPAVAAGVAQAVSTVAAPPTSEERGLVDASAPRSGRTAVLAFVSQLVSSATNFLRLVFITRVCTDSQLGDYALGMTLILWVMSVHERLVLTPYSVFAHRYEPDDRGRLVGNTLLGSLASTISPSLFLVAAGLFGWSTGGLRGMGPTLVVVGMITPVVILREFARTVAFTNFRVGTALGIDAATLVVQAVLIAALWATDTVTVSTLYGAVAVSCLVAIGGWLAAWWGRWSVELSRLTLDWNALWSYARWLLAGRVMGALSRLLVPWVVVPVVGKAEAGLLATCVSLVGVAWMFLRGVSNYFVPCVLKSNQEGGAAAVKRSVALMALAFTLLLTPFCVLTAAAGDWLLTTVYSDKLDGLGVTAFLLSLNALATAWAIAASIGLLAFDRPRDNVWIEGVTLVATLIAAPLMTVAWGVAGAAGAMLAGNLAGAALAAGLFLRTLASGPEPREAIHG